MRKLFNTFVMKFSSEILKDIVDDLQSGLKCFIHRETGEVVSYMDPEQFPDIDYDIWKDDVKKTKSKKFIEIEPMSSIDSFQIMEEFVGNLDDNPTKIRLQTAIEGHKPFANFKIQIENSGEYRQMWFAFKEQKYTEWVADQLQFKNS